MAADDTTREQERLDALEQQIADAKRHAEEATEIGPEGLFTDSEPAFHESGDHPEDDDQTIAPPG